MSKGEIKVLMVSHMYPSANRPMFGTFVRDKTLTLRRLNVDARVCAPVEKIPWPFGLLKRYQHKPTLNKYQDEIPVIRFPWITFPKRIFETTLRRFAYLKLFKAKNILFGSENIHLIHANDLFPDGFACVQLSLKLNVPLITTSHGGDNRVHAKHPNRKVATFLAAEKSSRIICVSNFVRDELINLGIDPTKTVTIYNGIEINRIKKHNETNNIRNKYGNKIIVLSVGHLVLKEKGFDIVINAFQILLKKHPFCNAILVVVGDGPLRSELQSMVNYYKLNNNIFFEGAKDPNEVMQFMNACDIFCLPSWYEAFGIVFLEAMAHGKPIIGVAGQGISEIINNNESGFLVPPRDPENTYKILIELINNKILRINIGNNGKKLVEERYTERQSAIETLDVYKDILKI